VSSSFANTIRRDHLTYFTSDLHLGHANIIKLCDRPFDSVEEMDEAIIKNWNKRVKTNDTVYILGDVVWNKKKVAYYMEQLSGNKILITGNHDASWCRREDCQRHFSLVTQYLEVSLNSHPMTLCHYPMVEWKDSREELPRKLGYHIHGHIHNRVSDEYRYLFREFNALNAGVDVNNFTPVGFDELLENNYRFKLSALPGEDREYFLAKYERFNSEFQ